MDELKRFITQRLGSDASAVIKKIEENKIDPFVVSLMTDSDLKEYFPTYGDRLAVVDFCKRSIEDRHTKERKIRVLKSLRRKLGLGERHEKDSSDEEQPCKGDMERFGNQNGKKTLRGIEMGWMTFEVKSRTYKQVRVKRGGGTRKLKVEKRKKKEDLLNIGKELFFPGGTSSIGSLSDFIFDIQDYKGTSMSVTDTVEDIYASSRLNIIRFYLVTTPCEQASDNDNISNEGIVSKPSDTELPKIQFVKSRRKAAAAAGSVHQLQSTNIEVSEGIQAVHKEGNNISSNDSKIYVGNNTDINENVIQSNVGDIWNPQVIDSDGSTISSDQITFNTQQFDLYDLIMPSPDDTVQFRIQPLTSSTPVHESRSKPPELVNLIIRRGYAFDDLMEAFMKDENLGKQSKHINIQRTLPNGETEAADDYGGVMRDLITEFWETFYSRCTLGTLCKVPFLRHDFSEKQWDCIVRVLKAGYEQCEYFPIMLAPSFVHRVITRGPVNENMLLSDFLNFVGEAERSILKAALENPENVALNLEDLTDIFEEHKARRIPNAENLRRTLIEIAEKELIQEPTYVIDIWHSYFEELFTTSYVDELLKNYMPNSRKVIALLQFPDDMSQPQRDVASYLKKFLKELDSKLIAKFLRFITGADIICTREIRVEFTSETGFSSRPIAHTCGSLLQLPTDYSSYPDFRSQFLEILNSQVWVMDFI